MEKLVTIKCKRLFGILVRSLAKGVFTPSDLIPVIVRVLVKVKRCANGEGQFDWQNGFQTDSTRQPLIQCLTLTGTLTVTGTGSERANTP